MEFSRQEYWSELIFPSSSGDVQEEELLIRTLISFELYDFLIITQYIHTLHICYSYGNYAYSSCPTIVNYQDDLISFHYSTWITGREWSLNMLFQNTSFGLILISWLLWTFHLVFLIIYFSKLETEILIFLLNTPVSNKHDYQKHIFIFSFILFPSLNILVSLDSCFVCLFVFLS